MVKVIYNDQLLYTVVIWTYFAISLSKEKVALNSDTHSMLFQDFRYN